ncbi:MAG: signal peptidase I [Defluviitaleaceae bacterium]|nr:signal peptidase I [Defluviitaleaceae bacterium]
MKLTIFVAVLIVVFQTIYLFAPFAVLFDLFLRPIFFFALAAVVFQKTKYDIVPLGPIETQRSDFEARLRYVLFLGFLIFAAVLFYNVGADIWERIWIVGSMFATGEYIRFKLAQVSGRDIRVVILLSFALGYGYLLNLRELIWYEDIRGYLIHGVLPVVLLGALTSYYATKSDSVQAVSFFKLTALWVTGIVVAFSLGAFVYYPKVMHSDSMSESLERGSLVILRRIPENLHLREGDVIHFASSDTQILHRIVQYEYRNSERHFITRGDSNQENDPNPITQDDIIGIALTHLPFAGYPSIFINELFARV